VLISYKPPSERGVTTLMYVGDDDSVEKATSGSRWKPLLVVGAVAIAFLALSRPSSRERAASRVRSTIARRR
jgi:hypothetical protein